jgi:hypothetical protein
MLKTYNWKSGTAKKKDKSQLDSYIRTAVDQSLAENGYQKVAQGKPDFLIDYHYKVDRPSRSADLYTGINTSVGVDRTSSGSIGGVGFGARGSAGESSQVTLTIEISDAATPELLWRGSSNLLVPEYRGPEASASAVSRGVDKILAQFPPEP